MSDFYALYEDRALRVEECTNCGGEFFEPQCLQRCRECEDKFCGDCSSVCSLCNDGLFCIDCLSEDDDLLRVCSRCQGSNCYNCVNTCKKCGRLECDNCMVTSEPWCHVCFQVKCAVCRYLTKRKTPEGVRDTCGTCYWLAEKSRAAFNELTTGFSPVERFTQRDGDRSLRFRVMEFLI